MSQIAGSPAPQPAQCPHPMMQETITRSPTANRVTPLPASTILSDRFVSDRKPVDCRQIAVEEVQVGTADGGSVDRDHHARGAG